MEAPFGVLWSAATTPHAPFLPQPAGARRARPPSAHRPNPGSPPSARRLRPAGEWGLRHRPSPEGAATAGSAATQPPRPEESRGGLPAPPAPPRCRAASVSSPPSLPRHRPVRPGAVPQRSAPGRGGLTARRPGRVADGAVTGDRLSAGERASGRAAMRRWRLLPSVVLLAVLVPVRGDLSDFNLEEALATTKKPLPSRKPPASDLDDFSLEHALYPDDPKPGPPANPRDTDNPKQGPPANPKDTGGFDDSDLYDGSLPKGGGDERKGPSPNNGETAEVSEGAIAGIVSAVFATVVGAVSSFIAYQKKKLCFKQSADEENVNMDSHRGAQSEPPVQRTLLEN
ncbi:CD99 antigen [Numenius arquata]|uniref:CD99 antigen n=1 Tax=Numenius arquata TaxID=31919 RepID=UPI003D307D67